MRVAFTSLPDALVNQLAALSTQQSQLQNQVATGKRISQLSDDPAAMGRVLNWQVQDSQIAQYRSNIASLQQRASSSYGAIQGLQTLSQRAGEIATLADGTRSPQELQAYATEVNQLIQQGVQLANSQYQGSYLFGGTQTSRPPFVSTTDGSGDVTAVAYQGNDWVTSVEIAPGTTVSENVLGANATGSGPTALLADSRNGADFFSHLISLRNDLQSGNVSAISSVDAPALSKDEDNITSHIAANGVLQSQLATADSLAASQSSSLKGMISQDSDADLAQTLTRLSATQAAFQAALQSGASLLSQTQSLLDYVQ